MHGTATDPDPAYLATLLRHYEEEVEGEAWYRALADRMPAPEQKRKLLLLAEVERRTAEEMHPLIDRYGLAPASPTRLAEAGRREAAEGPRDWAGLVALMRETFPAYVAEFEAQERIAPPQDRPALARLTAHEVAVIGFLDREAADDPDSIRPLLRFLAAPDVTDQSK